MESDIFSPTRQNWAGGVFRGGTQTGVRRREGVCGTSLLQVWGKGVRHLHAGEPYSGGGALPTHRGAWCRRRLLISRMTNLPTVEILHSFCCCWPFWSSYRIPLPTTQLGGRELHLEVGKKTDRAKRQKWDKITSQFRDHLHPTCLYLFLYPHYYSHVTKKGVSLLFPFFLVVSFSLSSWISPKNPGRLWDVTDSLG